MTSHSIFKLFIQFFIVTFISIYLRIVWGKKQWFVISISRLRHSAGMPIIREGGYAREYRSENWGRVNPNRQRRRRQYESKGS